MKRQPTQAQRRSRAPSNGASVSHDPVGISKMNNDLSDGDRSEDQTALTTETISQLMDAQQIVPAAESVEIVIAHRDPQTRDTLTRVGTELRHRIRAICRTVPELRDACLPNPPDLILCGISLPEGEAIDALVEISEHDPTPAVVVTPKDSLQNAEEALRDHVMAYLVEPVDEDQIKPTIFLVCERFKQFELLKAENEDLRQSLADRKLIERAKGILMGQYEITEEEAFHRLRKVAQSKRTKLVTIAKLLIDATAQDNKAG